MSPGDKCLIVSYPYGFSAAGLIWSLSSRLVNMFIGKRPGVMRHKSAAATMDQTDIRGLVTTVHRSVMEAASL